MTIKLYLSFVALVAISCGDALPLDESVSDIFNSAQDEPQLAVLPVLYVFNVDELSQHLESVNGDEDFEVDNQSGLFQPARNKPQEHLEVNTRRDVNERSNSRVWENSNGKSTVNKNGFYDRHYGGSTGTGRPKYGGGLKFSNYLHRQN